MKILFIKRILLESVKKMVLEHKDEPYVLLWLLGNENNYGVASNADKKPDAYFKFANEVALWIKSVDKNQSCCSMQWRYAISG